ncbi:MAG: gliding motility-associated C-terminal domain-containing protein [Crocinitomicaceae bacterium]|nr:gliding motility-associated C-terminal domain-containing protein [Crocinitomicaceae bacterium]
MGRQFKIGCGRIQASLMTALILFVSSFVYSQDMSHEPGIYKFQENKGQWPGHVNFKADVSGGNIWLEQTRIIYHFYQRDDFHHHLGENLKEFDAEVKEHLIYAKFLGSNENPSLEKLSTCPEYYNYFIGNDKSRWAKNVKAYKEVVYKDLYPGIHLTFFEKEGQLKYEYQLDPGADPSQIQLKYYGAIKVKKTREGSIVVKGPLGEIIEEKPYVYQIKNGKVIEVESEFELSDDQVLSFNIGEYDPSLKLVIDPVLVFATYSGSVTDNFGMTATYAYDGKAYSAGMIYGNAYPAPDTSWNNTPNITVASTGVATTDAFVSKYSADGTTMIWTNFVGGGDNTQGTETVHSLICDKSDNIYMYGVTSSLDFPLMNAFQSSHSGGASLNVQFNGTNFGSVGTDIYVTKISADGLNLMGSTYIGGSQNDGVNYKVTSGSYNSVAAYDSLTTNYGDQFRGEIMLDSLNNIMIASCTRSTDFPTQTPFQAANAGQQDGVVFKLSSDFSSLLWSSYFGGSQNDACYSVKIDSSYNILMAGGTSSSNLPATIGALTPTYQGGKTDGFVAKITPDGTTLIRTSYIGTSVYDQTIFVETDRWNNVYIVGQSLGSMPIFNAPYSNPGSSQYIMKLTPDLTAIEYSTVFGNGNGQINISPSAFLVDVCGNVYVSGWGANILQSVPLNGMPTTTDAFQQTSPNGFDFYLFVLERDAQSVLYASYMGGNQADEHVDGGTSRFDKFGVVYQSVCGGCGGISDFPTTAGAWSSQNLSSNCNNLIFKYDFEIVPVAEFLISDLEGCAPFTFILDNESNDTINSVWTFPPEAIVVQGGVNPQIMFESPGQYEIILSITDTICNLQDTALKIINVYDSLNLNVSNDTVLCNSISIDIWANSNGTATSFNWYDDPGLTNQINAGGLDSAITVNPVVTTTYYVQATNGWSLCDKIDSVTIYMSDGAMSIDPADSICVGDTTQLMAHNLLPSQSITYTWSPTQDIVQTDDSIAWVNPPSSQYFYVTGVTSSGCVFTDSVWVHVDWIDPATVYATATPDSIPEGGSSVLEAFPNDPSYTYLWAPPLGLSSNIGQTVTTSVEQTTTYTMLMSGNGCTRTATVTVYVLEFICGDIYIFIPSAFTPNGDGENDMVYVRGQNLEEIDLKIFDRWGELVFEATDQSQGWDGTFKGKPLDPDVYVYHLKAVCFDGQETLIKGNITLLR